MKGKTPETDTHAGSQIHSIFEKNPLPDFQLKKRLLNLKFPKSSDVGVRPPSGKEQKQEAVSLTYVGSSAITPAPPARNCAVDRRIAEPIGVTDVRVQ